MSACGDPLSNPFCLNEKPTDPYSWVYGSDEKWRQALQYSSRKNYVSQDVVMYKGLLYVCVPPQAGGSCTNIGPLDTSSPWTSVSSLQGPDEHLECTSSGPTADPQTGSCERTPNNSICVNPCIRLDTNALAVNMNTTQCRVFPGATAGGNAIGNTSHCPTVCPQACVELWESCPPGTGPLTTLIQTKSPEDLMSLTGPYRLDGTLNPLWPSNYATDFGPPGTIVGKPYTECYSYNTDFCELPSARQETVYASGASGPTGLPSGLPNGPLGTTGQMVTVCYSNCPAGTYQDNVNTKECRFLSADGTQSDDPTDGLQPVYCNPQYFNPSYWTNTGYTGIQRGCLAKALPSKQGSTCPAGTSAILNENFNIEWCIPECPSGYTTDLSRSTCIASCEGSYSDATTSAVLFNTFLDIVDFYAMSFRCATLNGLSIDCVQNNTPGRCPAPQIVPINSAVFAYSPSQDLGLTSPSAVRQNASSMNSQCSAKLFKDKKLSREAFGSVMQSMEAVKAFQNSKATADEVNGSCPDGMAFGDPSCGENSSLCYDECATGYEPITFCANGQKTCNIDQTVMACRALCPASDEGLGPWREVNADPLYTCAYVYAQGPPSDPNLWVQCPSDGRYNTLTSSPTDVSLTATARQEPLCVRQTFLRQSCCPNGFNGITDATTGQTTCVQACNSTDVVVTLPSGVVCQSTPAQSKRHSIDFVAVADSDKTAPNFKHRVLTRHNFTRGLGSDANNGLSDPNTPGLGPTGKTATAFGGVAVVLLLGFAFFHYRSKRSAVKVPPKAE